MGTLGIRTGGDDGGRGPGSIAAPKILDQSTISIQIGRLAEPGPRRARKRGGAGSRAEVMKNLI